MPAQRSCKIRIILWVGGIFLPAAFLCKSSAALDPGRQINQYGHAAWRLQDGVLGSMPTAITQTTDGYLWIGTKTGLVRFDGMRFVPWALPGQHLPSDSIYSLQAAADNSLWIGTGAGLAHWKNGLLTNYPDAPGLIDSIIEDHRRAIWFTRSRVRDTKGPLCQALETNARCYGQPDGIPFPYAGPLAEDQQRNLWIGSTTALMRWMPGSFSSYAPNGLKPAEGLSGVNALAPASDGSLWVGIGRQGPGLGLQQLSQGVWKPFATSELDGSSLEVTALFLDSENSLWVGTSRQGIYRIHNRKVDHFRSTDGLSGDQIFSFYQDREGVLWVVTSKGIDSFRDLRVVTFSTAQGLSADNVGSVLASREGAVWISNHPGLDVLRNGTVSSISPAKGLPGERVTSLLEDHAGLLWIGVDNGLFVYDQEKFSKVVKPDGTPIGVIVAITEEVTGDIWAETVGRSQALVHIHNRRVSEEITTAQIPRARALASDPQGGIWLGLLNDGLGHYQQGRFETFRYSPGAAVRDVIIDPDGSVLGATETGLIAWRNGSQRTLTTQNGLPCNQIYTLISDTFGSLWLYAECGLIEISREQLKGWWDKPETTVNVRVFDVFDGADPSSSSFRPSASRSQDGMLWFANENVLQMIDPAHLAMNTLPPPVHVENIIADRKSYSLKQDLRLPPLTRDLEIDYTALSFVVPQKVRFRYKLDGWDADWQSAGTRRQAFYTNLGPRRYSFRVMACNNDGVWNEIGASVDFLIVPAFYQTPWFAVAASLSIVCLLSLIYLVRLGQVTSQVRARLYARLSERERIARDLHDTFFQGIQGLLLRFHTATMQMRKDEPARPIFEAALRESDQVMLEGRELVLDLHTSTTDSYELPSALVAAGNEFKIAYPTAFKILVNGDPQPLHPIVSEESYKIGREALYNAFRHAGAHTIEAELNYEPNELRLRIRDDGAGIDPNVLKDGFRKGHWGLPGMRKRASKIGAHFAVWSRLNSGTEVELRVRAAVAYRSMPKSLWRRWLPGAVARNEQSYD